MNEISVERIIQYLDEFKLYALNCMDMSPDSEYIKGELFLCQDLLNFIKNDGNKVIEFSFGENNISVSREWLSD